MQPQSGRLFGTVIQQRGFPDTAGTLNQHRLTVTTSRREQQRTELLNLRFTFEEFHQVHFGGSNVLNGIHIRSGVAVVGLDCTPDEWLALRCPPR
jgi:hypothetical protein